MLQRDLAKKGLKRKVSVGRRRPRQWLWAYYQLGIQVGSQGQSQASLGVCLERRPVALVTGNSPASGLSNCQAPGGKDWSLLSLGIKML